MLDLPEWITVDVLNQCFINFLDYLPIDGINMCVEEEAKGVTI
jgi:hypothetical protein